MPDYTPDPHNSDAVLRDALYRWESERGPAAPAFDAVRSRIAAAPSALEDSHWSPGRSWRLAASLVWAQARIVPWLVAPVALATTVLAMLVARFVGASQDTGPALTMFSSVLLVGAVVTVTMVLSNTEPDTVSLTTPLGPQVVLLSRVTLVLALVAVLGVAASVIVAGWGTSGGIAALLAGWMVPLAMIAGTATFVAIWSAPWAGVVTSLVLVPFVVPGSGAATEFGPGAFSGVLLDALTPVGVVAVGLVLFTGAVASARLALTAGAPAT